MEKSFRPFNEFSAQAQKVVFPIFAIADDEIIPLGTGFLIMPNGLLMTAKHVLEDFSQKRVKRKNGGYYNSVSIFSLFVRDEKHGENHGFYNGGPINILKVYYRPDLDIALCWLEGATINGEWFTFESVVALSIEIPELQTYIAGAGYYKSNAIFTKESILEKKVIDYEHQTALTGGKVVEILPPEGEGFRKFPNFRTDARFEPGMSGGPVFDNKGAVCGVICSSHGPNLDHDEYISYVSLLWPALAIEIDTRFDDDAFETKITILELLKRGLIKSDKKWLDQIEIFSDEQGNKGIRFLSDLYKIP